MRGKKRDSLGRRLVLIESGARFGRLTIIEEAPRRRRPCGVLARYYKYQCDCGKTGEVSQSNLTSTHTQSCGCLAREIAARSVRIISETHGLTQTVEYDTWVGMKQRCYNVAAREYPRYGARGIVLCDQWLNSFENFLADMGKRPTPQHSIDRINNDGPYAPDNCRWATRKQQQRNRRLNRLVRYQDKVYCFTELAEILNLSRAALDWRIKKNQIECFDVEA